MLNSVNQSSFGICGSSDVHCDKYRPLGCDAVHTCRHLPSQATNHFTPTVELEERIWKMYVPPIVLTKYLALRSSSK